MRYLLDTGIAADVIHRREPARSQARKAAQAGHILGISAAVEAELWFGVEHSQEPTRNGARLSRALAHFRIWPLDRAAARRYGKIAATLRRSGCEIQQNDLHTAAIALALGDCIVVTKDSDFQRVPGLRVENWSL